MWAWLKNAFSWLVEKFVAIFDWVLTIIYNILVEVAEFIFDKLVDLFTLALGLIPDFDLSGFLSPFTTVISYVDALNDLLPISEAFFCVCFLILYYLAFAFIRTIIKLIPTIG